MVRVWEVESRTCVWTIEGSVYDDEWRLKFLLGREDVGCGGEGEGKMRVVD